MGSGASATCYYAETNKIINIINEVTLYILKLHYTY